MPDDRFPKSNQNLEPIKPVEEPTEEFMEDYYDNRASRYDEIEEGQHRTERREKAYRYYIEKLEKLLAPGGITYLDFGCATGKQTRQFLSGLKNNPVEEGFGITRSGNEVALATQTLPEFKVIKGGVNEIDFQDKFDLITSFFYVLGHLSVAGLEKFFQNATRSLKPGGVLCFDVSKSEPLAPGETVKYDEYETKLQNGTVLKGPDDKPLIGKIRGISEEEIVNLAVKNNLEIVDIAIQSDDEGKYEEYTVILRKKILS